MKYLQGNTYELELKLSRNGEILQPKDVDTIQFILNDIEKIYPDEVFFSEDKGAYIIPLTQEDTFSLRGAVKRQVRVKYSDGAVEGSKVINDSVYESITRKIL